MKNKKQMSLILIIAIFITATYFFITKSEKDTTSSSTKDYAEVKKIIIATCPTYLEPAKRLDPEKYYLIPTASTAESADLLASGEADIILGGRTLKPGEKASDSLILAEGFSFLADRGLTISIEEAKDAIIYTDIEAEKLEKSLPGFEFLQVDDVYDYLEEGMVLTSWENTDYARAQIVHVLEKDNSRLPMSRQATLYCPSMCDQQVAIDIKSVFE